MWPTRLMWGSVAMVRLFLISGAMVPPSNAMRQDHAEVVARALERPKRGAQLALDAEDPLIDDALVTVIGWIVVTVPNCVDQTLTTR